MTPSRSSKKKLPYSGFARFYDRVNEDTDYRGWRDYLLRIASKWNLDFSGCIDLGGGTGSLAKVFAEKNFKTDVADLSKEMLSAARKKSYKIRPQFIHADIRRLKLKKSYSAAFCLNNTVNYVTNLKELRTAFISMAGILKNGGCLIADSCPLEHYQKHYAGRLFQKTFNNFSWFWGHNKPADKTAAFEISVVEASGKVHLEKHLNRFHSVPEIIKAASPAFECLAVLGGFRLTGPRTSDQEIYFVFRKIS